MNKSLACHLMPVWISELTKRNRRNNLNCLVKASCAAMVAILLTVLPSMAAENVKSWGSSEYGQLGNGISGFSIFYNTTFQGPEAVIGLSSVKAVAAGAGFSLALKSDGTVWAWGTNSCGELGNGGNHYSTVPVLVSNLTGVVAIAAWGMNGDFGGGRPPWHVGQSVALKGDGTVWDWGCGRSNVPAVVSNLSGVVAVAIGEYGSLALKGDGTVWTWDGSIAFCRYRSAICGCGRDCRRERQLGVEGRSDGLAIRLRYTVSTDGPR